MKAEYLDHMGNDLTVVNAARVSFDAVSTELSHKDVGLIHFLARGCMKKDWDSLIDRLQETDTDEDTAIGPLPATFAASRVEIEDILKHVKNMPTHWTPFSHAMISMRETVPIFVARQRFKHMVGFTYNEVSRRYVDDTPEFYVPAEWRTRPDGNIKQGSGETHFDNEYLCDDYAEMVERAQVAYNELIKYGVAPEQARMILPQSMLTTYWVTGSLYAWANAYIQRSDAHAQKEIQDLAKQWDEIIRPLFPVSWTALVD